MLFRSLSMLYTYNWKVEQNHTTIEHNQTTVEHNQACFYNAEWIEQNVQYHLLCSTVEQNQSRPEWEYEYALLQSKINVGQNGSISMLYYLLRANLLVEQIQSSPEWEFEYALPQSKINLGQKRSMSMLYHLLKANLLVEQIQSGP